MANKENIQQFNEEELHLYLVDKLGEEVGGDTLDTFDEVWDCFVNTYHSRNLRAAPLRRFFWILERLGRAAAVKYFIMQIVMRPS